MLSLFIETTMDKILTFLRLKKKTRNLEIITKEQLAKNMEVIKSLRDYDQGKKDIPTHNVQKHLPRVRVTDEEL